ncbi:MAG: hypothetical protein NTY06_02755 [Candidatus Gottesmanbacteria bacterium]|nr:hypothetical protein [Candidatus Gottesmanbacteria bacterium]
MDFSGPGVIYALMIIPSLCVFVVILQGIEKMVKHEPDGKIAIGFGIVFLILIALAYFLYIK